MLPCPVWILYVDQKDPFALVCLIIFRRANHGNVTVAVVAIVKPPGAGHVSPRTGKRPGETIT